MAPRVQLRRSDQDGGTGVPDHLDAAQRRRLGAWYTPTDLVERLLDLTLEPVLDVQTRPRVVDPTCGTGNFLAAAKRRLVARGLSDRVAQSCLVGIDLDPMALEVASAVLPRSLLLQGDAFDIELDPVDVVIGNPPFLTPLRNRTRRTTAGTHYADVSALLLQRWANLLRPGGRIGFVMPISFLAAADCRPARDDLARLGTVKALEPIPRGAFDAAVETLLTVIATDGADARALDRMPTWSPLVAAELGLNTPDIDVGMPRLGSIARATADFRDQYYGMVDAVSDGANGPPLITSALIGEGTIRWGERSVRFAKQRFEAPRVDVDRLDERMQLWASRRLVPKVLVATQTRTLRAALDRGGDWIPGVPVITVEALDPEDLDRILAAVLHPDATRWALSEFYGAALSRSAIKLSARQLLELPLFER